jgi:two-component system chemotaxis response regulator CheB
VPPDRVVAIGASAGGVEAVSRIAAALPARFPAAVLVTVHVSASTPSVLPAILARAGRLPAAAVADGEPVVAGRIYVAAPDRHLVVHDGRAWSDRGPREHHSRPAVDPMFRSVAAEYGDRAIGVVLSGALDDGTAGLIAIKRAGGIAVVQDPDTALHHGMPASAAAHADVDVVLPLDGIVPYLVSVVGPPPDGPHEGATMEHDTGESQVQHPPAPHPHPPAGAVPSAYSCPDCGGVLWEIDDGGFVRYRCRIGHAFTSETLQQTQGEGVEQALSAALRALEERAALSRRMADGARERGHVHTAARFDEAAVDAEHSARVVNELLLRPGSPVVERQSAEG